MHTIEALRSLVPLSAYLTVSLLVSLYRRPLEELLAGELSKEKTPGICRSRIDVLDAKERAARWSIRYGFPRMYKIVFLLYAASSFVLWPFSVLMSIRFYLGETHKHKMLREICNDI